MRYQLIRRDIVARYQRSVLGILWTMLQPLGIMVVLTLVFSNLFGRTQDYPAYLLSGLIALGFIGSLYTAYRVAKNHHAGPQLWRTFVPYATLVVVLTIMNVYLFVLPMAMRM